MKPDRLARSTRNLLDIVDDLEKRGIALVVLSMGGQRIDTRSSTGKLMLTMLGAIATFERDLMLERQREGIAAAKVKGLYKGRKPTVRMQAGEIHRLHAEGISNAEIARRLGVHRANVGRVLVHGAE